MQPDNARALSICGYFDDVQRKRLAGYSDSSKIAKFCHHEEAHLKVYTWDDRLTEQ
ncbi:hypothetical protein KIN20_002480, partial [Parelaphostrongylus tenuis]